MAEAYVDMHRLPEDERIKLIGRAVMLHGKTCSVFVDDQPLDKRERYANKLRQQFPGIVLSAWMPGTAGTVYCIAAPPKTGQGVN